MNKIICGDCLEVMRGWPDGCVDTVITDPPYGLGFMGKEWDTFKKGYIPGAAKNYKEVSIKYGRIRSDTGKPFMCGRETPAAVAGSYDYSRNAEFQQWFTVWAKEVLRIAKPGAMMLVFGGTRTYHRLTCAIEDAGWQIRDCLMWIYGSGFPKSHNVGKKIDGWDGWGTALKPAWEPIILAMKPLDGTFAQNAEKWGVAGLNIDGGRIEGAVPQTVQGRSANIYGGGKGFAPEGQQISNPNSQGRWPTNLILDEEAAAMLDEQSGELKSGARKRQPQKEGVWNRVGAKMRYTRECEASSGGASRFFYVAKASRAERNRGLEGMEATLFSEEVEGMAFVRSADRKKADGVGGENPRNRTNKQKQNHHPTVKPLALMEYLCELTKTPTGGLVLDPFAGSGTTCIACVRTGRDFIGIEKEQEYVEIARRRLDKARTEQKQGQRGLFDKADNRRPPCAEKSNG